jgi:hypothetical protein
MKMTNDKFAIGHFTFVIFYFAMGELVFATADCRCRLLLPTAAADCCCRLPPASCSCLLLFAFTEAR